MKQQKKKSQGGGKKTFVSIKEVKMGSRTDRHDLVYKVKNIRRFIERGQRVKVSVLFRGRELQHIDEGRRIIVSMVEKLADMAKIEKAPSMEGKRMTAMLAPK